MPASWFTLGLIMVQQFQGSYACTEAGDSQPGREAAGSIVSTMGGKMVLSSPLHVQHRVNASQTLGPMRIDDVGKWRVRGGLRGNPGQEEGSWGTGFSTILSLPLAAFVNMGYSRTSLGHVFSHLQDGEDNKNHLSEIRFPRWQTLRFACSMGMALRNEVHEGGRTGQWEKVNCDEFSTAASADPMGLSW